MEIKYEAVFGDYKFSSPVCEIAMQSSFGEIIEMGFAKPLVIPEGWGVIAMRRIIAEPKRWTMEDKKAGRLPVVGCKVVFVNDEDLIAPDNMVYPENGTNVEIVGETKTSDGRYDVVVFKWLHEDGLSQRYAASGYCSDFNPIESPEEKAARLREEWVSKATFMTTYEIYDDLLSGELPVPVAPEQNK